jgi:hypothetical protein
MARACFFNFTACVRFVTRLGWPWPAVFVVLLAVWAPHIYTDNKIVVTCHMHVGDNLPFHFGNKTTKRPFDCDTFVSVNATHANNRSHTEKPEGSDGLLYSYLNYGAVAVDRLSETAQVCLISTESLSCIRHVRRALELDRPTGLVVVAREDSLELGWPTAEGERNACVWYGRNEKGGIHIWDNGRRGRGLGLQTCIRCDAPRPRPHPRPRPRSLSPWRPRGLL